MVDREYRLLEDRRDNFQRSQEIRKRLAFVSLGIILVLLSSMIWWVRRELRLGRRHMRKLDQFAHIDHLTGLPNRRQFQLMSATMLALCQRQQGMMAIMMMDLDGFKGVNDRYGHDVGDQLLNEVGRRLQASIRASDLAARFGGDEFAIVMSEVEDIDNVHTLAQKLINALAAPYILSAAQCSSVGASIGIACFPEHGEDIPTLLYKADQALYAAKRAGRRRYILYDASIRELEQI